MPDSRTVVLGITLGGGELGTVVLAPHGPLYVRMLNLGKLRSRIGKEASFRHRVERLLETYPVTHIAAVLPHARQVDAEVVSAQRSWLDQLGGRQRKHLVLHHRREVFTRMIGKPRVGVRALCEVLEPLYPSLWSRVPRAIPIPNGHLLPNVTWRNRRVIPKRERYWSPALVACAAAHLTLHGS